MSECACEACYRRHSAPPAQCRCGATSPSLSICTECNHEIQLSHRKPVIVDLQLETEQRAFAKLHFRASYRRDGHDTELTLRMEQIDFGVMGCIQTKRELGHVIQEVDIKIQPSVAWAGECGKVTAKPCISPRTFSMQQSTTLSTQFAPLNPRASTLGCQRSKAVGWAADAFGWSTASVEPIHSKHVHWNWTLDSWRNGASFPTKSPGSSVLFLGSIPKLPLNPLSVPYHSNGLETEFEAKWLVPHSALTGLRHIQWDLTVDLYTVRFVSTGFLVHVGSFRRPLTHEDLLTFEPEHRALPEEESVIGSSWLFSNPFAPEECRTFGSLL